MFINLTLFLENLLGIRLLWMDGHLGSGKTLFAFALSDHLLRLGLVDGVITNCPSVWPPALGADDGTLYRRVVIFDEAWTHLDSRDSLVNASDYGAYARKMNSYWLLPSVFQIDKRLRSVTVWRDYVLTLPFLPPIWVYRWCLDMSRTADAGWFALYNPARFYGMYHTDWVPTDDGGIMSRWINTVYGMTSGRGVDHGPKLRDYLSQLSQLPLDGGADVS